VSHGRITTRFAPSPTGELHLGNARTALFSWLFARHHGGRFILRIEDTDTERSKEFYTAALMDDLRWMGLAWDAGPDSAAKDGAAGEYYQSRRGPIYARHSAALDARGFTYPCYCTPLELELSRKAQLAAGRPPRYAGTCRELSPEARVRKSAQGISPTTRFRVPTGKVVEFDDMVHGPQRFATDDIGDFILRRADGSAAFFFSNAIDDSEMGVTHVLRGEDHLTNTPRQLLVLEALDLRAPTYGHLSLLVGADGTPLSKRHGATSVREFRERGYLPAALNNHLFRLGHSSSETGVLSLDAMARAFTVKHLGSATSHITCRSKTANAGSRRRRRATSMPRGAAPSSPRSGPTCCCRPTWRAGARWCSDPHPRSTSSRWRGSARQARSSSVPPRRRPPPVAHSTRSSKR
jgi:glutamyl-tRNA synthetase